MMTFPRPVDERAQLAAANRHIAMAERRIAEQRDRIEELRKAGHACRSSEDLLALLLDGLSAMHLHREQILRALADIRRDRRRGVKGATGPRG